MRCLGTGSVSIRDLRNHGGEAVDRAARGELITITRSGRAVAELRALAKPPLSAASLLERLEDPTALPAEPLITAVTPARAAGRPARRR